MLKHLIVGHIMFGLVAAVITYLLNSGGIATSVFCGLVFCQASLIGIWGAMAQMRVLPRIIGTVTATIYLSVIFGFGIEEFDWYIFLFISLSVAIALATLIVVRRWFAQLRRCDTLDDAISDGLQFSIRHLFIVTLVAAVLITMFRFVTPRLNGFSIELSLRIAAIAFCCVVVTLATVWSTLGMRGVAWRWVIALAISIGAGFLVGHFVISSGDDWFWTMNFLLHDVFLLISLLLVRGDGWVLVRLE